MLLKDYKVRDPFILPFDGKYYLYKSVGIPGKAGGFACAVSSDLVNWSEPEVCFTPPEGFWATRQYWAPEVHLYNGRFYLFATFMAEGHMRATQIMASDKPEGPFEVWSCPVTPPDWMCLDGTLYVEDGAPYIVFCHEWLQVGDGEVCAMPLSHDLKAPAGEPRLLFRASDAKWSKTHNGKDQITDGPFLHRNADGRLIMTWSSFGRDGSKYYAGVAYSSNGRLDGEWINCDEPIYSADGGHGMLFSGFDGRLYFTLHSPNAPGGEERCRIFPATEIAREPFLKLDLTSL